MSKLYKFSRRLVFLNIVFRMCIQPLLPVRTASQILFEMLFQRFTHIVASIFRSVNFKYQWEKVVLIFQISIVFLVLTFQIFQPEDIRRYIDETLSIKSPKRSISEEVINRTLPGEAHVNIVSRCFLPFSHYYFFVISSLLNLYIYTNRLELSGIG